MSDTTKTTLLKIYLIIGAIITSLSMIGVFTYFQYTQAEAVAENQRQEKLSKEKEARALMAAKQALLEEYNACMARAIKSYEEEWIGNCNSHPSEQRADGTCHTLPIYLAREISNDLKDREDRCEIAYRNQMQALGVRQ